VDACGGPLRPGRRSDQEGSVESEQRYTGWSGSSGAARRPRFAGSRRRNHEPGRQRTADEFGRVMSRGIRDGEQLGHGVVRCATGMNPGHLCIGTVAVTRAAATCVRRRLACNGGHESTQHAQQQRGHDDPILEPIEQPTPWRRDPNSCVQTIYTEIPAERGAASFP